MMKCLHGELAAHSTAQKGSFWFCYICPVHVEKEKCCIESSRFFCLQCFSTFCFPFRTEFLYSILDYIILKGFKGMRAIRLCSLRFMHCTMEVILDELRKKNVDIDILINGLIKYLIVTRSCTARWLSI